MKRYIKATETVYSTDTIVMDGNYVAPDKLAGALKQFGEISDMDLLLEVKAGYNREKNKTAIFYKYIDDSATQDYAEFADSMK